MMEMIEMGIEHARVLLKITCTASLWTVLILPDLSASQTFAGTIDIVDQSQTEVDVVIGIPEVDTMWQTFTPELSAVDFVELQMFDSSLDTNGGSLFLRIREDTIDGDILGTSPVTFLEDCFQFPEGPGCGMIATDLAPVRFEFLESVLVNPGQTYLIEIVFDGGDSLGVAFAADNYAGGVGFVEGFDQFDLDLTFREGIVVPEPSTALLFGVVCLIAGGRRRWADRPVRPCFPV